MSAEAYLGVDVLFDVEGDLDVGRSGDLELAVGRDCLLQGTSATDSELYRVIFTDIPIGVAGSAC